MTQRRKVLWMGFVALAATTLIVTGSRGEGEDKHFQEVDKIAAAVKKGDEGEAKKMAQKFEKADEDNFFDAMTTMKLRSGKDDMGKPLELKVKGFGIGKPGSMEPDGIEKMVQEIAKNGIKADDLKKNAAALEEAAHRITAIGNVAQSHKPKKMVPLWKGYADKMTDLSQDFTKAIKSGDPAAVKTAATKLDANCNQCHEKFR